MEAAALPGRCLVVHHRTERAYTVNLVSIITLISGVALGIGSLVGALVSVARHRSIAIEHKEECGIAEQNELDSHAKTVVSMLEKQCSLLERELKDGREDWLRREENFERRIQSLEGTVRELYGMRLVACARAATCSKYTPLAMPCVSEAAAEAK